MLKRFIPGNPGSAPTGASSEPPFLRNGSRYGPASNERGMILVISLMVLLAMTALGMAVFYSSAVDFKIAGNERSSRVAYYAAQSGLVDAKKRLEDNTPETTGYAGYCKPSPTGEVSPSTCDLLDPGWQLPSGLINGTLPNGSTYEVNITHVALKNSTGWYVKRGDESDWWPYYRITSTGTYLNSSKTLEEYTYLDVVDTWNKAVISCGDIEINNNAGTDSFDSDSSVYNGLSTGDEGDILVDGSVTLFNQSGFRGSIESTGPISMRQNSKIIGGLTSGSTITIESNTIVTGDVTSSLESAESISVSSGCDDIGGVGYIQTTATIDDPGGIIANVVATTLGKVESPEACNPEKWLKVKATKEQNSNSDTNITRDKTGAPDCDAAWQECLDGGCCRLCPNTVTVTLQGGADEQHPLRYHFDGLKTDKNVTLVTTGFVEIYVDGNIEILNNAVFCGDIPAADCFVPANKSSYPNSPAEQLLLYGHGQSRDGTCTQEGTDLKVNVDNNSYVFGKIYAPDASSTIIDNNSEVFGAVVGGGMCAECLGGMDQNAMVHYDAAIANTTTRNASVMTSSRKECFYGTLDSDLASDTYAEYWATGSCRLAP